MRTTGRITTVPIVARDAPDRARRGAAVAGNSMMVAISVFSRAPKFMITAVPRAPTSQAKRHALLTIPMPHLDVTSEKTERAAATLSRKPEIMVLGSPL